MPTTVAEAFAAVGLSPEGVVRWGEAPKTSASGVYIVSLTKSLGAHHNKLISAPLAPVEFKRWLGACSKLTLDDMRPTQQQLITRIQRFWLPDEVILYVGRASSLSARLRGYYRTPIGARRPHSGGYFLKLLSNLDQLWVHYALCPDPVLAEDGMLHRFLENVSGDSKRVLHDPDHPFPFANLELTGRVRARKVHGLRGVRKAQPPSLSSTDTLASRVTGLVQSSAAQRKKPYRTQRVTANDLKSGQIRIPPIGAASTKTLFPDKKATVKVLLRGRLLPGSWDPRMGPVRERSGVLRLGAELRKLVRENEVLAVSQRLAMD